LRARELHTGEQVTRKVIFALVLATAIGLISWLVQNYQSAGKLFLYADVLLVVVLVITLILINRKIFERHQATEGGVKMEMGVVITVTFFIGALMYMVG